MDLKIKKPKIFYGWYILAIGMFGAFMGAGTSQVFMSTMLKPLTEEFGWSRTTATGAFLFAVLFGLTSRGEATLVNIILAHYYGRSSYGAISGFVYPFNMVGLGFGPLICSLGFDLTGSYQMLFSVFVAASLISALLLWLAKKPTLPAGNLRTHPPAEI
jgi:MFS family permease